MYSDADGSAAGRSEGTLRSYNKARVGPLWWMEDGEFCTQLTSGLVRCKWEFYRSGDEIRMYNPATSNLHAVYVVEQGDTRGLKSVVVK